MRQRPAACAAAALAVAMVLLMSIAPPGNATPGTAIRFFGTGTADTDRVKLRIDGPPNSADVGASDFTIEFWTKADPSNTGAACDSWICGNIIVDRDIYDSGGGRDFGISVNSYYGPGQVYFGTGITEHVLRGQTNIADGSWHHVAVTRVRSTGEKCLYVDGSPDAPCEVSTTGDLSFPDGYSGVSPDDPFLVIGAEKHDAGPAYPSFFGTVDEIRVWDLARTPLEIAASMNTSLSGSEGGLVVYWRLDEGSGVVAADSSGDGNHGEVKTGTPGAAEWVVSTAPIGPGEPDADGDGVPTITEAPCGSDPLDGASVPERTDLPGDDDGDTAVDEALPGGASAYDCDGDGYKGSAEASVYNGSTVGDQDPCGTGPSPPGGTPIGWPADTAAAGGFSANKVNISDLAIYVGVPRYFNTNVGTNTGDYRLDVVPGSTFGPHINIIDLQNIAFGAPPMLGGVRMFNGPVCPW